MGIRGLYNEIGPGDRIALSKLACEFFEKTGRPLRVAIDISIWLFQIQAADGGTNPALRTFYYRILRLIALSIYPVFVFDGPNKPPFKRHKRTMAPGLKTVSIPEFLAKQLLKHFALPIHLAPGEAEAECALLQRLGYVDAVLSDDADTLMFGSGLTFRNYSPEGSLKSSVPTHVNVYEAQKVKSTAGLDREGMILVALMSGGDYIPEGMPGCGPKIACEAARAGFGNDLCKLERHDDAGFATWKQRLAHELCTNENKFFGRKHPSLVIPEDFPRRDILRFYTDPCVSTASELSKQLPEKLKWDLDIDISALRSFAGDAFEWFYVSGAKKFIRNLAPALLVKQLRLRGSRIDSNMDNTFEIAEREDQLIKSIHLKRSHISTDRTTEVRVGFIPLQLVPLDLSSETPDPENTGDFDMDEEDEAIADGEEELYSPKKKRGPSKYDPGKLEKIWVLETFVKVGTPLKFQDWEENTRQAEKAKETKKRGAKTHDRPNESGGMAIGSLDKYAKIVKPGNRLPKVDGKGLAHRPGLISTTRDDTRIPPTEPTMTSSTLSQRATFRMPASPPHPPSTAPQPTIIDLLSSPTQPEKEKSRSKFRSRHDMIDDTGGRMQTTITEKTQKDQSTARSPPASQSTLPSTVTVRRQRSPLRRAHTSSGIPLDDSNNRESTARPVSKKTFKMPPGLTGTQLRSAEFENPVQNALDPFTHSSLNSQSNQKADSTLVETISLCASPSTPRRRQRSILDWASPSSRPHLQLTPTKDSSVRKDAQSASLQGVPSRLLEEPDHRMISQTSTARDISTEAQNWKQDGLNATLLPDGKRRPSEDRTGALRVLQSNVMAASDVLSFGTEAWTRMKSNKDQWRASKVDMVDLTDL